MNNLPDNNWQHYAACRNKWDLFDSVDVDGKDIYPHLEEARALCKTCPVFKECNAAGGNELTNIWAAEVRGK